MNFNLKKKTVATLTLATAIAVTPLVFTACNTTPGDNHGTGAEQPDDTNGKYSQVLQNVIESNYYINLIAENKSNGSINFSNPLFYATPYAFLENKGHDVNSIKNGDLECKTSIYTLNNNTNNVYLSILVENKGSKDYYSNYVIKYNLSKQEYADLTMLYQNNYVQAPLFIQELSKQKTAEINSAVNITCDSYDQLSNFLKNNDFVSSTVFGTKELEIDVLSVSESERTLNLAIRTKPNYNEMIEDNFQKRNLNLVLWDPPKIDTSNSVVSLISVRIKSANTEEFQSTYTPVTYFNLANLTSNSYLTLEQ